MKAGKIFLIVIVLLIVIFGFSLIGSYNSMVTQSQAVDTSWSQVETQYQRRFDLVPNLVNATKGVLKQEQTVFGAIADARTHYGGATTQSDKIAATNQYESALSRLLIVMENYPQLKSIESVRTLTDELSGTENRVLVARDRYNVQVQGYNTMISRFPKNLYAGMFGFHKRDFFKSDDGAKVAPTVNLDLNNEK